jgi:hypothetical protein
MTADASPLGWRAVAGQAARQAKVPVQSEDRSLTVTQPLGTVHWR